MPRPFLLLRFQQPHPYIAELLSEKNPLRMETGGGFPLGWPLLLLIRFLAI